MYFSLKISVLASAFRFAGIEFLGSNTGLLKKFFRNSALPNTFLIPNGSAALLVLRWPSARSNHVSGARPPFLCMICWTIAILAFVHGFRGAGRGSGAASNRFHFIPDPRSTKLFMVKSGKTIRYRYLRKVVHWWYR